MGQLSAVGCRNSVEMVVVVGILLFVCCCATMLPMAMAEHLVEECRGFDNETIKCSPNRNLCFWAKCEHSQFKGCFTGTPSQLNATYDSKCQEYGSGHIVPDSVRYCNWNLCNTVVGPADQQQEEINVRGINVA